MNRRAFLSRSALASAGLTQLPLLDGGNFGPSVPATGEISAGRCNRPNILFLFTDQWRHDIFGYAGNPQVRTPNLDRLAMQSVNFRRAYCPSPACGPSRASLFTGHYPAVHGHRRNADSHDPELPLFTDRLRELGYRTGLVGKLHLHPIQSDHGFDWKRISDAHYDTHDAEETEHNDYFDALAAMRGEASRAEWVARGGRTENMGSAAHEFWLGERWVDEAAHHTTWTAGESIRFINQQDGSQPWFLNASFFGPHHPYTTDFPWADVYNPAEVNLPPTLFRDKDSPIFEALKRGIHNEMAAWPKGVWPEMIAQYYGYCSQIDLAIGRILNALALRPDADNTWVVFSSDHGDHLGNWGLLGKADPYETSVRIPMLLCPPGGLQKPLQHDGVVNLMDLNDTFRHIADDSHFGEHSLRKVMDGESLPDHTWVFQGWARNNYHAVRVDRQRKCIVTNRPDGSRLHEAYRIDQDPWEERDLWPGVRQDSEWKASMDELNHWCREQEALLPERL